MFNRSKKVKLANETWHVKVNLPAVSMKTTPNFNERAAYSTSSELCQKRIKCWSVGKSKHPICDHNSTWIFTQKKYWWVMFDIHCLHAYNVDNIVKHHTLLVQISLSTLNNITKCLQVGSGIVDDLHVVSETLVWELGPAIGRSA